MMSLGSHGNTEDSDFVMIAKKKKKRGQEKKVQTKPLPATKNVPAPRAGTA